MSSIQPTGPYLVDSKNTLLTPVSVMNPAAGKLLDKIFRNYQGIPFRICFWNGAAWQSSVDDPEFVMVLRTEEAWKTLTTTADEAALGEQYVRGNIVIDGDLYQALRALPEIERAIESAVPASVQWLRSSLGACRSSLSRLARFGGLHSRMRDAAAISYHYDKPSSFYELWLGPAMAYSCAYFQAWDNELEVAQRDKMELICRKIDLKAGERFLDIGCGWGSLLRHAAERFGASAHGVSLSHEQVDYANRVIASRNLASRCKVELRDYRDLREEPQLFHKIASVGMCEHVGSSKIADYFADAHSLLAEGGLFLNHGITRAKHSQKKTSSFIDRYVFPDGELLTLTEMVQAAEGAGFEVRDIEDLREHYEETLHRWVEALEEHEDEAIMLTDEETYRIWRLYMVGSAEAFRRGEIGVYQMLLSKNTKGWSSATPTRGLWYHA